MELKIGIVDNQNGKENYKVCNDAENQKKPKNNYGGGVRKGRRLPTNNRRIMCMNDFFDEDDENLFADRHSRCRQHYYGLSYNIKIDTPNFNRNLEFK